MPKFKRIFFGGTIMKLLPIGTVVKPSEQAVRIWGPWLRDKIGKIYYINGGSYGVYFEDFDKRLHGLGGAVEDGHGWWFYLDFVDVVDTKEYTLEELL